MARSAAVAALSASLAVALLVAGPERAGASGPRPVPPVGAWPSSVGVEARAAALGRDLARNLSRAGVLPPAVMAADTGAAMGLFVPTTWTLQLSRAALGSVRPVPSSPEARAVAAVARHEARHAEQWFRMARLRAGQGRTAAQIAAEMGVPAPVATAAAAVAGAGPDPVAAQAWWDSVYGPGAARRTQVLTALLDSRAAYDAARTTYRSSPSPATGAALLEAQRRLDTAFASYRSLPEEADALAHQHAHERTLARAAR